MWRIGVIGCGWAGRRQSLALQELSDRATVVAAADVDVDRAQVLAADWPGATACGDYRALLEADGLDAVSICLPHSLHAEVAIAVAETGRHTLVEKPLAATLAEADAMIAAAQAAGVRLMVAETARFTAAFRRAAELIEDGAIGTVGLIRIERLLQMEQYLRDRPWFLADPAGGIMFSGGIHDFEIVRMLGGDIEHVYALRGPNAIPDMQSDDTSVALAGLAGGATAVLTESFAAQAGVPAKGGSVHGSSGSLYFTDESVQHFRSAGGDSVVAAEPVELQPADPFVEELRHFLDCLDSGAEPLTSGARQRPTLCAVLAAYESMRSGRRVYLTEET